MRRNRPHWTYDPRRWLRFLAWMIPEVVRANVRMARACLVGPDRRQPCTFHVRPPVSSDRALVALADLITLTPGTLTLECDTVRRELRVHVVDAPDPAAVRRTILTQYVPRVEALLR